MFSFYHVSSLLTKCVGIYDEDGHGTHVAGTLAGYPLSYNTTGNISLSHVREAGGSLWSTAQHAVGIAPGARLAVFDLSNGNERGALSTPPDMHEEYYKVQYDAGARVQSDSWGYDG